MEPKAGDIVFLDTNILLAATDENRPQHREAQRLIPEARRKGIHLALSGQILREYLVVATRPTEANGLGLGVEDALANAEEFLRHTVFYDETESVSVRLRGLVRNGGLSGKRIHDANVAATVLANGLRFVLTGNPEDFAEIPGLHVLALSDLCPRPSAGV